MRVRRVRFYLEDLPAGHAAVGRKDGTTAVIVVDKSHLADARDRGELDYGVRIANDILKAFESDVSGGVFSIAS
jgi:hypothetical protein